MKIDFGSIDINLNVKFFNAPDGETARLLRAVLTALGRIEAQGVKTMSTLDEVLVDVAAERTQIDSLATLTANIKAQLDAILAGSLTPEVQAKVDAVFAAIESNKQAVVDAINANTTTPTGPV